MPNPPPPTLVASELYVVTADGSDKRLLKRREFIGYPDAGRAVWSPDGQTIAFADYSRLFFVNAARVRGVVWPLKAAHIEGAPTV